MCPDDNNNDPWTLYLTQSSLSATKRQSRSKVPLGRESDVRADPVCKLRVSSQHLTPHFPGRGGGGGETCYVETHVMSHDKLVPSPRGELHIRTASYPHRQPYKNRSVFQLFVSAIIFSSYYKKEKNPVITLHNAHTRTHLPPVPCLSSSPVSLPLPRSTKRRRRGRRTKSPSRTTSKPGPAPSFRRISRFSRASPRVRSRKRR